MLDSGKHYTQAGHAMGDGDVLADKTSVCGEELTTTRGKLLERTRRFCSE